MPPTRHSRDRGARVQHVNEEKSGRLFSLTVQFRLVYNSNEIPRNNFDGYQNRDDKSVAERACTIDPMVDTSQQTIEGGPQPVGEASSDSTMAQYTIRCFHSGDAAGVTRLVEGVYGDTYYPRELYNPDKIVELNEAEKLVSVVALDSAGEVIGHYALERPDLGAVAEASDAIVALGYRHHHLL